MRMQIPPLNPSGNIADTLWRVVALYILLASNTRRQVRLLFLRAKFEREHVLVNTSKSNNGITPSL